MGSHDLTAWRNAGSQLFIPQSDLRQIRDVLNFALGSQAIDKIKGLTSTQACESANHSLSVSNPKSSRFPRSHRARTATRCLEWNGPKLAALKKQRLLGLPTSPGQNRFLESLQRKADYCCEYSKKTENIVRRHRRDSRLRRLRVCRQLHGDCGGDHVDEGDARSKCPQQQDHTYQSAKRRRK
ncbi:hypothetical protein ACOMHN_063187 [Nucella lapillus]